jgi:hypothetical protein
MLIGLLLSVLALVPVGLLLYGAHVECGHDLHSASWNNHGAT